MLDAALLEYSPLSSEFDSVQFESEWSILRTFQSSRKKAPPPIATSSPGSPIPKSSTTGTLSADHSRPPTPPSTAAKFATLRQTLGRGRGMSGTLNNNLADDTPSSSPKTITSFMTAMHTLFTIADLNPALVVQLWSQVMYWAACAFSFRSATPRLTSPQARHSIEY